MPFLYVSPSGNFRLAQWWRFQVSVFGGEYRAYLWGHRIL